jgi:lipopolysaccharide/colanic/teichoic acid biosynthesis glycosyltransferase
MLTKRVMDILVAGLALLVLAALMSVVGATIVFFDGRPILYRAVRVGQHGRLFRLYKFRTMMTSGRPPVVEGSAPAGGAPAARGSSVTVWADPRITPLGRVLRRLKLDELPQLFNVLRGDMSLVGPRPEDPEYVALYTDEQKRILELKPGITSVAALQYWDEVELLKGDDWEAVYRERLIPAKLAIEADYARSRTPWTDALVLGRTAISLGRRIVRGRRGS